MKVADFLIIIPERYQSSKKRRGSYQIQLVLVNTSTLFFFWGSQTPGMQHRGFCRTTVHFSKLIILRSNQFSREANRTQASPPLHTVIGSISDSQTEKRKYKENPIWKDAKEGGPLGFKVGAVHQSRGRSRSGALTEKP